MRKFIAALLFIPAIAAAQSGHNEARVCMSPQMRNHYLDATEWIEAQHWSGASESEALRAARVEFQGRDLSAVQQGIAAVYGP